MIISSALNRIGRRDLRLFEGDQLEIDLVVYALDGDTVPIDHDLITDARFVCRHTPAPLHIGSLVTVPRPWCGHRIEYRLVAEISGLTTTLCYGSIIVAGPFGMFSDIPPYNGSYYADFYADNYA